MLQLKQINTEPNRQHAPLRPSLLRPSQGHCVRSVGHSPTPPTSTPEYLGLVLVKSWTFALRHLQVTKRPLHRGTGRAPRGRLKTRLSQQPTTPGACAPRQSPSRPSPPTRLHFSLWPCPFLMSSLPLSPAVSPKTLGILSLPLALSTHTHAHTDTVPRRPACMACAWGRLLSWL